MQIIRIFFYNLKHFALILKLFLNIILNEKINIVNFFYFYRHFLISLK